MQACSLPAIDFGLPGAGLAPAFGAAAGASFAASVDASWVASFFFFAVPFGLTVTRGLSPTIGVLAASLPAGAGGLLCAMAAAEYRTATRTRIFFISIRSHCLSAERQCRDDMRPIEAYWRNPARPAPSLPGIRRPPRPREKHGATTLSRWQPALSGRLWPGCDHGQQRRGHKGRTHITRLVQQIVPIQQSADARADRLADVEHRS